MSHVSPSHSIFTKNNNNDGHYSGNSYYIIRTDSRSTNYLFTLPFDDNLHLPTLPPNKYHKLLCEHRNSYYPRIETGLWLSGRL